MGNIPHKVAAIIVAILQILGLLDGHRHSKKSDQVDTVKEVIPPVPIQHRKVHLPDQMIDLTSATERVLGGSPNGKPEEPSRR